jgi:hypothetical protein
MTCEIGTPQASRTDATASTALETALKGHGRIQQIGGGQEDDLLSQRSQNTDRIARIIINVVICRTFLRSVLTVTITPVGGSIARISQIATAAPTSEIGGFAGLLGLQRVRGRCGRCVRHMTGKDILRPQRSQ